MKKLLIISATFTALLFACKKEVDNSEYLLGIIICSYKLDTIDTIVFIDGKEYFSEDIIIRTSLQILKK